MASPKSPGKSAGPANVVAEDAVWRDRVAREEGYTRFWGSEKEFMQCSSPYHRMRGEDSLNNTQSSFNASLGAHHIAEQQQQNNSPTSPNSKAANTAGGLQHVSPLSLNNLNNIVQPGSNRSPIVHSVRLGSGHRLPQLSPEQSCRSIPSTTVLAHPDSPTARSVALKQAQEQQEKEFLHACLSPHRHYAVHGLLRPDMSKKVLLSNRHKGYGDINDEVAEATASTAASQVLRSPLRTRLGDAPPPVPQMYHRDTGVMSTQQASYTLRPSVELRETSPFRRQRFTNNN